MSISLESIYAALPSTTRGQPTILSADAKGERIAYASNKSIFIRSIDDPSIATQYTQHNHQTTVARISPSGFYCASGDVSGVIKIWDCSPNGSGITKGEYPIISGRINDIAWDGDSQRIIAVGDGKQRYGACVTADSGNSVGEITGHTSQIQAVSIRQQRPLRAATVGDDRNLIFYHGAPFKFNSIPARGTHTNYIYGTGFSPDGSLLVSVASDKKILVYDGKTGEYKKEISDSDGHKGSIFGMSWSKDSKSIVTCSGDRTVKTWDIEAGKVSHTWTFGEMPNILDQQVGVVWPHGRTDNLIISLSLNGDLNYLYPDSSKPRRVVSGHQKSITAITAPNHSSDPAIWTGSYEGRLCAWDAAKGAAETVEGSGHTNIVSGLATAPTAKTPQIFSVGWDDHLRTTDAGAKTYLGTATKLQSQPKAVTATSDGIVVVAQQESVVVYRDGDEDGELPLSVTPTALAASGSTVAIGAADSSLRLFSVVAGKAPRQTAIVDKVSSSEITALSFSNDGSMIAAGSSRGGISIYKVSTGLTGFVTGNVSLELVTDRWNGHTAKITNIVWNKEDTHAVSSSLDTNVFLWSLADPGRRVKATNAHKEGVTGVAWTVDGVFSTGADAAVKKWTVNL